MLACHKGGLGSIAGKCSNAASGQCSWPFLDSAQGRRKINRQALPLRRGIVFRSLALQRGILSSILTRMILLHLAAPADACRCHFCYSIQKTLEETQNEQRHMARSSGTYLTSLPFCPWFHGVMVST